MPDLVGFTLNEFIALRGVGAIAIAHDRKWCSECFSSDLETDLGPYDRLLWCIEDVQICPKHNVRLKNICPSCGGGPYRVLTGRDVSGFCPGCFVWLGGKSSVLDEDRDEHTKFLFWAAKSFADILESPLPSKLDVGQGVNTVLYALSGKYFDGNYAPLAKAIERNKSVLCTWLKGNGSPSWRALIEISFVFQVPLAELLQGQLDGIAISTIRRLPLAAVARLTKPRKLPERRDVEKIKAFLLSVEVGLEPNVTSMKGVADRININARYLRRIVPTESSRLSEVLAGRRKLLLIRKQEGREKLLRDEVPKIVSKMVTTGLLPTRRALWQALGEIGISARRDEAPLIKEIVQNTFSKIRALKISGNK